MFNLKKMDELSWVGLSSERGVLYVVSSGCIALALSRMIGSSMSIELLLSNNKSQIVSTPVESNVERLSSDSQKIVFIVGPTRNEKALEIARSLRRDYHSKIPLIFWGGGQIPEDGDITGPEVLGSYYLPFPSRFTDLAQVIGEALPVPDDQTLHAIIHRHCHYQEQRGILLHDLRNAIGAGKSNEIRDLSRRLDSLTQGAEDVEVRMALNQAETSLLSPPRTSQTTVGNAVPSEWRSLLIVDDDGYSDLTIAALKAYGYAPRPVVQTLEEALEELQDDPPDVVLGDYRLEGDLNKGKELAQRAMENEDVKLFIFISAAEIPLVDVPSGVRTLEGEAKFDAAQIHHAVLRAAQIG